MREDCPRGLTETPASPNKNEATVSELKTHYFQNTSACSPPDYLTETDIFHPLPTFPEKYSTEEERYNNFVTLIATEGSQHGRRLDMTICGALVSNCSCLT